MKRPLFVIAGGFVLGEVLGLREQFAFVLLLAAALTAIILWIFIRDRDASEGRSLRACLKVTAAKRPVMAGLLLFFTVSGFLRGDAERRISIYEAGLLLDGVRADVCGKVERIREREDRTEVLIRPAKDGSGAEELRYLLVYIDSRNQEKISGLSLGMQVSLRGKYSAFGSASNPGQFDYSAYYRAEKLSYRFFADYIEVVSRRVNLYDRCREFLRIASRRAAEILDLCADEQDAGILKSMLLGDKTGLAPEIRGLYQKSGISHILAISGLHLSLISAALYSILRRTGLGFGCSGLIAGMVLLGYCIMSGASVSSLRALIMLLLSYLAAWKGRSYDLLTALGFSAFLLFFESPYQLTQSGPLLSFLAVMGIAAVSSAEGRSGPLKTSLGISLVTAPVILWNYFRLPLYGVIINLFVLPLTGLVAASGAFGIIAGTINLSLGRFLLGAAHYILLWYDFICAFFNTLPGASLLLGRPTALQTGIYYAGLAFFWFHIGKRKTTKRLLTTVPLLLLLLPLPVINFNVLFMDVGQGDAILIRSGEGVILVDGGSSSVGDVCAERLEPCLESLAVSEIDYAFVSHGHSDHVSGLYRLLSPDSPVRVKNLVLPAAGRGAGIYDDLTERAQSAGAKVFLMEQGERIEHGKVSITCIYPPDSGGIPDEDANEHSLVLRVDYGGFSMLLGGDMTAGGESAILSDAPPGILSGISVLKVAHHGSSTSSSEPWLDAISPVWSVISYGKNNIYGHPAEVTMNALKKRNIIVYETARDGAVSLRTNGRRISWSTFLGR